jgi:hypothetical protein
MYQDLYTRLSQNMPLPDAPPAPAPASASYYGSNYGGAVQQVDAPTPGPSYGSRAAPASALASSKTLPPSLGGPGSRRR